MIFNQSKQNKGFGLIETIIAAGILMLIVGASLALINATVRNNQISRERTILNMLAQRGLERIRNIVDTNGIDENPQTSWSYHLSSPNPPLTDYVPNGFGQCPTTSPCSGQYRWGLGVPHCLSACIFFIDAVIIIDGYPYNPIYSISTSGNVKNIQVSVSSPRFDNTVKVVRNITLYDPQI